MEDPKKNELSTFKRNHFSKLHERIQNKYNEMQKKLNKSKSVDALTMLRDDYSYKEEKYASQIDIRDSDVFFEAESHASSLKHSIIVEDVHTNDASLRYFDFKEASISESELGFTPIEIRNNFFQDDFSRMSQTLNEISIESEKSVTPYSPSHPKNSIRNIIGSRISAAKEKRREAKEKNAAQDKKKESRDKVEKFVLSNTNKQDVLKTFKRTKVATVTIALIDATGLESDTLEEKSRMLGCRFKLGTEKYKSKVIKSHTTEVKWQELFNLNLYDECFLEISLWDNNVSIGRDVVDLYEIEKEKTNEMRIKFESESGNYQIFMLLTVSGTVLGNTLMDVDDYEDTQRRMSTVKKKFAWYHISNDSGGVGWLSVIVYGAKGLLAQDSFCVLELDNERRQTHTEFKTFEPNWMKIFMFTVNDITSILEIAVHDEKRSEDVGKVSIPLLKINSSEKKWYALKDVIQRDRAKGHNPRILLEMRITWNLVRASIRVINPKEVKHLELEEKLQKNTFSRNLSRAKAVLAWVFDAFQVTKTLFEWESTKSNLVALTIWLLFCWYFKVWMLPLLLLVPFLWYRPPKYYLVYWKGYFIREISIAEIEENSKKEKDEKNTSLRQKILSLQEMVQTVQNAIGKFASLGESIKNLFNFTVPYLSCLAIFMIMVIAFVMYIIPVKYIFMFWGIHKFTRKLLRPNRIPNNEILDLLSRVPDDETLLNVEELPLEEPDEDVIK